MGEPFFFIHVMKTAGMTFNRYIKQNFAAEECYPGPDDQSGVDYWVINNLRTAVEERRDEVRLWHGHFPYFVTDLVPEATTLSILREPVARVISLLDQHRRQNAPDKTLEEIYEDPKVFQRTVLHHQTKMFAMTADDGINAWTQHIDIDDQRFALAKERLGEVDLLGFQERFPAFLEAMETRYGWDMTPVERVNSAEERPVVSDAFRKRIADDNHYDMALYEFALANF